MVLDAAPPEAVAMIEAGTMSLEQGARIARLAKKDPEQAKSALAQLATGQRSADAGDSWGTPSEWIEAARAVMGGIDLDPASNEYAQRTVKADRYYTAQQDGLQQIWGGRVWLNPPYSQPLVSQFAEKLLASFPNVKQACVLVNNATDTQFGQSLLSACDAVCFTKGRVSFVAPGGGELTGTRQGQMLIYFGDRVSEFERVFSEKGVVFRGR